MLALAVWSAIGIILLSVCLSVTLCIVAKRHIIQQNVSTTEKEVPSTNTILQLSTPKPWVPQTPLFLNHRSLCHMGNKLKTYYEQENRQNFHAWNSRRLPSPAIPDSAVRLAASALLIGSQHSPGPESVGRPTKAIKFAGLKSLSRKETFSPKQNRQWMS